MDNEIMVSLTREDGKDCSFGETPYAVGNVVSTTHWYEGGDIELTRGLCFGSPEKMVCIYYDWPPARAFEVTPAKDSRTTAYGLNKAQSLRIIREIDFSEMILRVVQNKKEWSMYDRMTFFKIRNIPIEAMKILARNKSFYTRADVASHPSRYPEVERILTKDEDWRNRSTVAYYTIDPEILEILSEDKDSNIRTRTAENMHCKDKTLKCLKKDKEERVAKAALFTLKKLNRVQSKITDFQSTVSGFG